MGILFAISHGFDSVCVGRGGGEDISRLSYIPTLIEEQNYNIYTIRYDSGSFYIHI